MVAARNVLLESEKRKDYYNKGTVTVPQHRMEDMAQFKRPITKRDFRAFLGSVVYYRCSVQGLKTHQPCSHRWHRAGLCGCRRCWTPSTHCMSPMYSNCSVCV